MKKYHPSYQLKCDQVKRDKTTTRKELEEFEARLVSL